MLYWTEVPRRESHSRRFFFRFSRCLLKIDKVRAKKQNFEIKINGREKKIIITKISGKYPI